MKGIYVYRPRDPSSHPVGIEARAPRELAAWLRRFPASQPKKRDDEDWLESATIPLAADNLGLDLVVLESKGDQVHVHNSGWLTPKPRPDAPAGAMFGIWAVRDFTHGLPVDVDVVGSDARAVVAASDYASSAVFRRYAGRPIEISGGDVEGEGGIEAALRAVVDATGSGEVFVKTAQKNWATGFTVDPAAPKGLWRQISNADMTLEIADDPRALGLSFIPVTYEGVRSPVLIVQGLIRPTFEYRIVVIDGRPVTGSGCIEAFTPAENLGAAFDPQMEEVRSDGVVVERADLVRRYLDFAETFVAEFAAERGEGLDYSLDVCIDAVTGRVVPIELNPALNLGAYARSTEAWMKAIVARTERVAAERAVA